MGGRRIILTNGSPEAIYTAVVLRVYHDTGGLRVSLTGMLHYFQHMIIYISEHKA